MGVQQLDWTTLSPGLTLLGLLLLLYVYFLPSLLAFQRGHRRFWIILGLNIAIGILQPPLLQRILPVDQEEGNREAGLRAQPHILKIGRADLRVHRSRRRRGDRPRYRGRRRHLRPQARRGAPRSGPAPA